MTSPLALLYGIGQGATALGGQLDQDALERQRISQDALNRLATMTKLGMMPAGPNPQATLQNLMQQQTARSALINAPGAGAFSGGVDPSQYGQPSIAQLPTATGGTESYIMDPSRTPEALQEQRMLGAQDAAYRRQMDVEAQRAKSAQDVENQRTTAAATAAAQAAKVADARSAAEAFGYSQELRALSPSHPMLKNLPDPADTQAWVSLAPSLHEAVQLEGQRQAASNRAHWMPAGTDPNTGLPVLVNTDTGETKQGGGVKQAGGGASSAPVMARAGQLGLALNAASQVIPQGEQIQSQGLPFGAETANSAAQGQGFLGHIPFGSELGNKILNSRAPQYAQYETALPNLLLGAAHAMGGARINQEQVKMLAKGDEARYGDTADVGQQKVSDIIDFLNSARASLPPDMVAQEEATINPQVMQMLRQHGYGTAPTGRAAALVRAQDPTFQYQAFQAQQAGKPSLGDRIAQLKAQGLDKAAAQAQLIKEGYNLAGNP